MKNKKKILIIGSGPFSPDDMIKNDKYDFLRKEFVCYYLTPVSSLTIKKLNNGINKIKKDLYIVPMTYISSNGLLRNIFLFLLTIYKGLKLFFYNKKKFCVVISKNPLITGLCANIISRVTSTKSIVEINGNYKASFKYSRLGSEKLTRSEINKQKIAELLSSLVCRYAHALKLLYAEQINSITDSSKIIKSQKLFTFPDFVPVNLFYGRCIQDKKYILTVGYPWYLKGVDLLINAFNKISDQFPEYNLKVVGWCPEGKDYFERLSNGNKRIELIDPVPYKDIMPYFLNCSLYVLASRTEAMGMVLLEAMASRKPIIASDVDGVPNIIKDGYNGLLFEKENIDDLSKKIVYLLENKIKARELGINGYNYVYKELTEKKYIKNYKNLIRDILCQ